MKGKKLKETIGKYGEIIRERDIVNTGEDTGIVTKIIRVGNEDIVYVYDDQEKWTQKVKAVKCTSYMGIKLVKRWLKHDKLSGGHKYINYKDIDGIQLAENMMLRNAFLGQEIWYYVTKNENGEYILRKLKLMKHRKGDEILEITEAHTGYEVRKKLSGEIIFYNR